MIVITVTCTGRSSWACDRAWGKFRCSWLVGCCILENVNHVCIYFNICLFYSLALLTHAKLERSMSWPAMRANRRATGYSTSRFWRCQIVCEYTLILCRWMSSMAEWWYSWTISEQQSSFFPKSAQQGPSNRWYLISNYPEKLYVWCIVI